MRDEPINIPTTSMFIKIKGLLEKGHVVKVNGCKVTKEGLALRYKGVKVTKSQWDALVGDDVDLEVSAGPYPEFTATTPLYSRNSTWTSTYTKHNGVKVPNIPEKTKVLVVPLDMISNCRMLYTEQGTACTIQLSPELDAEFMSTLVKRVETAIRKRP